MDPSETWRPVTQDEVIRQWLITEATNPDHQYADLYQQAANLVTGNRFLSASFFTDDSKTDERRQVFDLVRGDYRLWAPIRNSTTWYDVAMVIKPTETRIHGPFKPEGSLSPSATISGMILWGHERSGPFVILDGNHRWHSVEASYLHTVVSQVYVGLSNTKFELHSETGCKLCLCTQQ